MLGSDAAHPLVLPFLLCSLVAVALAVWPLAAPLAGVAALLKAAATLAWVRGGTVRARNRLGFAILFDVCALLAWGGQLLTDPRVPLVGVAGIVLALLGFARLHRWETLEHHRWAVQQAIQRAERQAEEQDREGGRADNVGRDHEGRDHEGGLERPPPPSAPPPAAQSTERWPYSWWSSRQ